jgi:hypothetical protein
MSCPDEIWSVVRYDSVMYQPELQAPITSALLPICSAADVNSDECMAVPLKVACVHGDSSQSIKQSSITDLHTFPGTSGTLGRASNPVANTRCLTVRILTLPSRLTSTVQAFLVSSQDAFLIVVALQTLSSRNFAYPSNQSAN